MSPDEAVALAQRLAVLVPAGPVALCWDHQAGRIAKRPLTRHGHLDWCTDPETIRRQFNAATLRPGEELGVGVWPGPADWWVLDLDVGDDADGRDTLHDLELEHGELPPHVVVATPSGGEHRYLRKAAERHIGNAHGFGSGIDVRGDDGWVVAPGVTCPWGAWTVTQDGQMPDADTIPAWAWERLTAGNGDEGQHEGAQPLARDALGEQDLAALEALERLDGHHPFVVGRVVHVTRRGKSAGTSATIGYLGPGIAKVFTSNWPPLRADAVYDADVLKAIADAWQAGDKAKAERLASPFAGVGGDEPDAGKAAGDTTAAPSVTLNALLAGDDDDPYDWLVPGLVERGDRVVITGDEGWGKSTLLRQVGLGATAGVNTFAGSLLEADHTSLVVLAVDCENSTRQLRREFAKVRRALDPDVLAAAGDRYHVAVRTEGLVLDQPKDPTGDRAWLEAEIAKHRPAILLIGPLYKLMGGNPNDEADARMLALYLDRLRGTNAHMAIVIEAHAPHGQKRPYGWSGWKRWPEFGLHLSDDGSLTPFRGGRDDSRHWPRHLRRGRDDDWPWVPTGQPAASALDPEDEYEARVRQVVQRVLNAHRGIWLSQADIIDRAGRRKAAVVKALCHYRDNGWLLTASEDRAHGAVTRPTEVYRLDPKGTAGDHNA